MSSEKAAWLLPLAVAGVVLVLPALGILYVYLDGERAAQAAHDAAAQSYKLLLSMDEALYGAESSAVADDCLTLAEHYSDRGLPRKAEPYLRRAVSIREKDSDPDKLCDTVALLARNCLARKQLAEAVQLYRQAIALKDKAIAARQPAYAGELLQAAALASELATVHYNQGEYDLAEPLYQRALDLRRKELPPGHRDVATALSDLADNYCFQERYREAEELYRQVVAARESSAAPDRLELSQSLRDLATCLNNQDRYAEAEPLYRRALTMRQAVLGPAHPALASFLREQGDNAFSAGKTEEAQLLYQHALALLESAGETGPELVWALHGMARCQEAAGDGSRAELTLRRALAHLERQQERSPADLLRLTTVLANCCYRQKDYRQAAALYENAVALSRTTRWPYPEEGLEALDGYSDILRRNGRLEEAAAMEVKARALAAELRRARKQEASATSR